MTRLSTQEREGKRKVDSSPLLLRVPGWERFAWLRAGFSTRQGGQSSAYGAGELNLGWTAEDKPDMVARNRAAFVSALGDEEPLQLVTVGQVHGAAVRDLERETPPLMRPDGRARLEGDGMVSRTPGRLLAILTADCVPVLIADTRTHAIGAFHAGWRGTLAGIVRSGIAGMQRDYGSRPQDLVAAIGPCIQACCFQIGSEVRDAFTKGSPEAHSLFSTAPDGSLHMDLAEANRLQLLAAGLPAASISDLGECTACSRTSEGHRRFFSYRAEQGRTGRMLSGVAALA